jgi:tetrathionate reductase subunit A
MGCPTYYPQQLSDGTPFEEIYPTEQWPFLLCSYKSIIQSGSSITSNRLRGFHGFNTLGLNRQDAEARGIKNGEKIRLTTPGGQLTGIAQLRDGIARGTIGIEHGFGHRELGVRTHHIGDKTMQGEPKVGAGVNLNDIGLIDPHRKTATLLDWAVGSSARQALPAQIERLS